MHGPNLIQIREIERFEFFLSQKPMIVMHGPNLIQIREIERSEFFSSQKPMVPSIVNISNKKTSGPFHFGIFNKNPWWPISSIFDFL